ncbi:ribose transport system substrate-binding protein [Bacillus thermophilus]|uniref:Ribose transport system substrate-binding protein n=1 Tax=Siminovitchia thermophila TaxID=1245522 RepID=A0ABS2R8Y9_9BACI|nr:sugar ABC transporter substrate-binding protein [Siminovitchia thermophila]MBM7716112.1 ribose transport system substrate-binding protein [Siminovitchia thermophila]ONK23027.1 hypothetical protein BLX87_12780 [Bacillus sp. VT-16-64]
MIKKSFLSFGMLIAILSIVGCGNQASEDHAESANTKKNGGGKPQVAVVLKGSDQEYFKLAEAGAKQAFKDFDVEGKFLAATKETQEQELINLLEDLLTNSPDALVVMPSTSAVIPTLSKYHEKDIPVLLIDTDLEWENQLTYIGTDNFTAGQKAAEHLSSMLSEGDEVAIIEGVSGAAQNEARIAGAKDYFKKHKIKVASVQAADFDRTKAVNTMENMITAHPKVKGVFAANDEMALGASQAIQTNKLDIPIIGIDGTTDGLASIAQGDVTATIEQQPFNMTYLAVENALKAIKGDPVEKNINSGIELITIENAQDKLEKVKQLLGK